MTYSDRTVIIKHHILKHHILELPTIREGWMRPSALTAEAWPIHKLGLRISEGLTREYYYGQFSEFHVCFCGLDSGNLKFDTVRTHKQRICF